MIDTALQTSPSSCDFCEWQSSLGGSGFLVYCSSSGSFPIWFRSTLSLNSHLFLAFWLPAKPSSILFYWFTSSYCSYAFLKSSFLLFKSHQPPRHCANPIFSMELCVTFPGRRNPLSFPRSASFTVPLSWHITTSILYYNWSHTAYSLASSLVVGLGASPRLLHCVRYGPFFINIYWIN